MTTIQPMKRSQYQPSPALKTNWQRAEQAQPPMMTPDYKGVGCSGRSSGGREGSL
jgi:hypothetical protein